MRFPQGQLMMNHQCLEEFLRSLLTMIANEVRIAGRVNAGKVGKSKIAVCLNEPMLRVVWIHKAFCQF